MLKLGANPNSDVYNYSDDASQGLGDPCSPDEERDILLSGDDNAFLEKYGNKVSPVDEGKDFSPAMFIFIRNITKVYRLCYVRFVRMSAGTMSGEYGEKTS